MDFGIRQAWESRQSFTFTFARLGEYRYLCRQHLLHGMVRTITVKRGRDFAGAEREDHGQKRPSARG